MWVCHLFEGTPFLWLCRKNTATTAHFGPTSTLKCPKPSALPPMNLEPNVGTRRSRPGPFKRTLVQTRRAVLGKGAEGGGDGAPGARPPRAGLGLQEPPGHRVTWDSEDSEDSRRRGRREPRSQAALISNHRGNFHFHSFQGSESFHANPQKPRGNSRSLEKSDG